MRLALLSDPGNFHTAKWGGALARAGLDVTVLSYDPPAGMLPAVQVPLPPASGGRLRYPAYLQGGPALSRALAQARTDIVLALNATPFGVWAQRSGFRPYVVSAMGADILEFLPASMRPPGLASRSWDNVEGASGGWPALKAALSRPMYRRWVRQALVGAAHVTADNQTLVDAIVQGFGLAPEAVELLRWGLEPAAFVPDPVRQEALRRRLGLPDGIPVLFSPRGLKAVYQPDIILRAYLRMLASGAPPACLLMLGAGYPVSAQARALASEARAAGGHVVLVEEMLPREDLGQLWGLVDVFISAPVYDGYSAALAEGRYAGAVPVVNAIPGNLELIRDMENGLVCDPFDPEKLAGVLGRALADLAAMKGRFAEVNRRWIEAHSLVDQNARRFAKTLEEVLRRHRQGGAGAR